MADAETIGLGKALSIGAAYQVSVGGLMNTTVGAADTKEVVGAQKIMVGQSSSLSAKSIALEASDEIELKTGSSSLSMKKDGTIELAGTDVTVKTAAGKVHIDAGGIITIKGSMVKLNT